MTGSYLLMDGGLRDAQSTMRQLDEQNPAAQEMVRHMQASAERTARLQPLIDQR